MQNEDVPTVTHDGLERMPADSEVNLGIETPNVDYRIVYELMNSCSN
jgi:hypothetical protein